VDHRANEDQPQLLTAYVDLPGRTGDGTLVTTMATIHEFDTVTLRQAHGRWLPGTTGAVLETFGQDAALVELVGPGGASFDMLTVPITDLDPVPPSAAPHGLIPTASLAETIEDPTSPGLYQPSALCGALAEVVSRQRSNLYAGPAMNRLPTRSSQ